MKGAVLALLLLFGLEASTAFAAEDVRGSKDHPLVSRLPGSHIVFYHFTDFDQYGLAKGPSDAEQGPPVNSLEGKITTVIYHAGTASDSVIKIHRNYRQSFDKAGFKTLFECENDKCGRRFGAKLLGENARKGLYSYTDPWNMGNGGDFRVWNGQLTKGDKTVFVNLIIEKKTFGEFPAVITLDVIEPEAMATGLITINPAYLAEQLNASGRVVLAGVYFDHNKIELKSDSKPALHAIAQYLKLNPKANVYIVGHTDNVGQHEANVTLASGRATAVVSALVSQFGVAKSRLHAVGVGAVAPIASNANEDGKAQNRRVEMVLK